MASRQEEKERRRREREEAERKAQRSGEGRKRLAIVLGGALAVAIVAIVVVAVAAGGEDGGGGGASSAPNSGITNLAQAARAAGCEVQEFREDGRGHTSEAVEYKTNPPTSGAHDPVPAQDGIYAPGNPPDVEQSVHSLEHGRVLFQYREGTPQNRIDQLEALLNEEVKGTEGYHTLLFQNQTNMPHAVAATSWRNMLSCPRITDATFDALRAFRLQRVDKAPEFIP